MLNYKFNNREKMKYTAVYPDGSTKNLTYRGQRLEDKKKYRGEFSKIKKDQSNIVVYIHDKPVTSFSTEPYEKEDAKRIRETGSGLGIDFYMQFDFNIKEFT
jgi:hypothetical protein